MKGDNGPVCASNECLAFDLKKKTYIHNVYLRNSLKTFCLSANLEIFPYPTFHLSDPNYNCAILCTYMLRTNKLNKEKLKIQWTQHLPNSPH